MPQPHALLLHYVVYHSLTKWVIEMHLSLHLHLPLEHYPANRKQFAKKPTIFVLVLLLLSAGFLLQDCPFALFHLKDYRWLFVLKKLRSLSTDLPFYFQEQIFCEYPYSVGQLLMSFPFSLPL